MRLRGSRARRPAALFGLSRTLTPHGWRTLIACAVVALICARLFGGA